MSSNNSTSTFFGLPLPSLNFGNNIIDVSSLTTLIGSTVGESLVLGTRGPAGLAWSSTSSFGLLWIIRGCINGASPGWLREVIGIRSSVSDSCLGMELNWYSIRSGAIRKSLSQAIGIVCDNYIEDENEKPGKHSESIETAREVYVFDRLSTNKIKVIPETNEEPIRIFSYADYVYYRVHDTRFQVIAIGLSLLKLSETVVLLFYDAPLLAAITTLPWAYFFTAAIALEIRENRLKRNPEPVNGELDIITGVLPTVTRPGGPKKVILGMAKNPKRTLWLRLIWGLGSVLCIICLAMTYFIMGQQNQGVSFVWICFQIIWMLARMALHYLADFEDPHGHRSFAEKVEERRPLSWKHRVLRLTVAVAKYQTLLHPRTEMAYKNDCYSVEELAHLIQHSIKTLFPLSSEQETTDTINVNVVRIVGDTLLSSAAWITGSKLGPMEIYDSCIVTFSITTDSEDRPTLLSIPAARVYSYESPSSGEENDTGIREYIPKGAPNTGVGMYWWYFVPATAEKWLVLRRAAELGKGKCEGRVMSSVQLMKQLLSGQLNVDIRDVYDIQKVIDTSRTVCRSCLLELIG